jgi:hypothetical protein
MMRRPTISVLSIAVVALATAACSGDDDDEAGGDSVASATATAPLAGGVGGVLILNGSEIPLIRATCLLDDDTFEASATSGEGLQVFAVQDNPLNPVTARLVDADLVEWSPDGVQGDEAIRDGPTITSETYTYVNDLGDFTIEASFTIVCP